MAKSRYQRKYDGTNVNDPVISLLDYIVDAPGTLTGNFVYCAGNVIDTPAQINVRKNGVQLFDPGDEPEIAVGQSMSVIEGINFEVARGDKISLEVLDAGGGLISPIFWIGETDDGETTVAVIPRLDGDARGELQTNALKKLAGRKINFPSLTFLQYAGGALGAAFDPENGVSVVSDEIVLDTETDDYSDLYLTDPETDLRDAFIEFSISQMPTGDGGAYFLFFNYSAPYVAENYRHNFNFNFTTGELVTDIKTEAGDFGEETHVLDYAVEKYRIRHNADDQVLFLESYKAGIWTVLREVDAGNGESLDGVEFNIGTFNDPGETINELKISAIRSNVFLSDAENADRFVFWNNSTRQIELGDMTEKIQDIVAAMMQTGSHTSWTYNDATGQLTVDAAQLTDEEIQDKVAAFLTAGANTTLTYNDGANTLTVAETTAGATTEEIQDMIATFLQQGSNVTLTYNDASNTLTVAASGGGGGSLPSQTGNAGKNLMTNGTSESWQFPCVPDTATPNATTDTPSTTMGYPLRYDNDTGRLWLYDGVAWNYFSRTGTLASLAALMPWAYFEADNEAGGHGAAATGWADQSGNARDMTNGSTIPSKDVTGGFHSFDFTTGFFNFPSMSGVTSAEIFFVLKQNSASGNLRLHGLSNAAITDFYYTFSSQIYDGFFSSARKDNIVPGITLTNIHCLNIESQANLWKLRTNGTERHSTVSNTISAPTAGTIGKNSNGTGFNGKIYAIYVFNRVLTSGDRASMQAHITGKYGVTFS